MSVLKSCPHCSSFNPADQDVCLHCDQALIQLSTKSSLVRRVLKTAGVITMSMSLTACYGMVDVEQCQAPDADGDGTCETFDCNDNDPAVQFDCGGAQAPIGGETEGLEP